MISTILHYNLSRLYNGCFIISETNGVQGKKQNRNNDFKAHGFIKEENIENFNLHLLKQTKY